MADSPVPTKSDAPPSRSAVPDIHCPICRSGSPIGLPPPLPLRIVLYVVGLALPIPSDWHEARRVRCAVCTHEWSRDA